MDASELMPAPRGRFPFGRAASLGLLLMMALALAGCGSGVSAGAPFAQPTTAVVAQAQPLSGENQGPATPQPTVTIQWMQAGDVTVTPVAGQDNSANGSSPGGLSAGNVTPQPAVPDTGGAATGGTAAQAAPDTGYQAVSFAGTADSLPNTPDWHGDWQVSGRTVHVDGNTNIDQRQGQVHVGARVAIQGWQRPDGSVDAGWVIVLPDNSAATPTPGPSSPSTPAGGSGGATEDNGQGTASSEASGVLGHPIVIRGTVDGLPRNSLVGQWTVSGRPVRVIAHTRLQQQFGPIAPGAYVQVMGWTQADGSINAAWIQTKKPNPGRGNGKDLPPGQARKAGDGNPDQSQGSHGEDNQNQGENRQNDQPDDTTGLQAEWQGTCQQLPQGTLVGTWIVDGQRVVVAKTTRVEAAGDAVRPGAYVDISGWPQSDGTFYATRIRLAPGWPAAKYSAQPGAGDSRGDGKGGSGNNGKGNGNGRDKGNDKGNGKGNGH